MSKNVDESCSHIIKGKLLDQGTSDQWTVYVICIKIKQAIFLRNVYMFAKLIGKLRNQSPRIPGWC